jgi:hypothetical protein
LRLGSGAVKFLKIDVNAAPARNTSSGPIPSGGSRITAVKLMISLSLRLAMASVAFMIASGLGLQPTTAAESLKGSIKTLSQQKSLTDTPGGPKDQLRRLGIETDVWMTQF